MKYTQTVGGSLSAAPRCPHCTSSRFARSRARRSPWPLRGPVRPLGLTCSPGKMSPGHFSSVSQPLFFAAALRPSFAMLTAARHEAIGCSARFTSFRVTSQTSEGAIACPLGLPRRPALAGIGGSGAVEDTEKVRGTFAVRDR
jgi:hypothetical protein